MNAMKPVPNGVCALLLIMMSWLPLPATAQVLGLLVEAPASASAGATFNTRTRVSVSGASTTQLVVWLSWETTLHQDFGQVDVLEFVSATNGGQFTAVPIVVSGVAIPAGSVFWNLGARAAGTAFALDATLRPVNGSLSGTIHALTGSAQDGPTGSSGQSAVVTSTVTAQPRPASAVLAGEGWLLFSGNVVAPIGGDAQIIVRASNAATTGTETLYQARTWLGLSPLCAALAEPLPDCLARIEAISDGGILEPDFDPQDDGNPVGPALVWSLGALAPGVIQNRSFRLALPAGTPEGVQFSLSSQLESVRSSPASASQTFILGLDAFQAPSLAFALGERIRGVTSIGAGSNDLPDMSVGFGEVFSVLARVANTGLSAPGDILQIIRIPEALHFSEAFIPASAGGRVFYSMEEGFTDPAVPPPVDLSAVIGNSNLPDSIDLPGNAFWQALDLDAPAQPEAVRWVAFYVPRLASAFFPEPGVLSSVIGDIGLTPAQELCAASSVSVRGELRAFSSTPVGGDEVAIEPAIAIADIEPVSLASNALSISLTASGASSATAGSSTPSQINFTLRNLSTRPISGVPVRLSWSALSINGVAAFPEFVGASGGVVDASDAGSGEVIVTVASLAPGAQTNVSVSLRYPVGIVSGSTHVVDADVELTGSACGPASASASRAIQLLGSAQLQVLASADQAALLSGEALSFSGTHRNIGTAVATAAFVYGPVPPNTVFQRAELAPGRRLLCSAPPLDAGLPPDLRDPGFVFNASVFASQFVEGTEESDGWRCPESGATSWIALALDDASLAPPSFVVGSDETWRLHLVNDEIRDEPDAQQQGSPPGTEIPFELAIQSSGLFPAISNTVAATVIDESTPLAVLALGDDAGGMMQITAGVDDNPGVAIAPGGEVALGIRLANVGMAALGDIVHFVRLPQGLAFEDVVLPVDAPGRVFYATSGDFTDPEVPPPVDLSVVIGNDLLPDDIDAEGNAIWQRLDTSPPGDPASVRWIALYLRDLPAGAEAESLIPMRSVHLECSQVLRTLRAPTRVFSTTPPGGVEAPVAPSALALSDVEPIRLAAASADPDLQASGPEDITVGTGVPTAYEFIVQNTGNTPLPSAQLGIYWFPVQIGEDQVLPEFVAADGGTVDASGAANGVVLIELGTLAAGSETTASFSLNFQAGVTEGTSFQLYVEVLGSGGDCGNGFDFALLNATLRGAELQVNAVADQSTISAGAELSFTASHANPGTAAAFGAFVLAAVPEHTSFLHAELPLGHSLLCSTTPPEVDPLDPPDFELGEVSGDNWTCPQGGASNWIVVLPFDAINGPFLFPPGSDDSWRLHLRNDEVRDHPDEVQQPSPEGTLISLSLSLHATDMATVESEAAVVTVGAPPVASPQAGFALGDNLGGSLLITPGVDDHPEATLPPGGAFELGLELSNSGDVALGDLIQFVRIPEGLRFDVATLSEGLIGRVFHSSSAGFTDPETPPPVDMASVIGNAELPSNINPAGQDHWRALDLDPPASPDAVRWVAFYLVDLGVDAEAVSRLGLQVAQAPCALQSLQIPATARVFSMNTGDGEVAIDPAPLSLVDMEPVALDAAAPALALSADGELQLVIQPEGSLLMRSYTLSNTGPVALPQATLALAWPSLSINGAAMLPDFVSASGGELDESQLANGELGILFPPIASGAQATATLSLRYPPGIVDGATHSVHGEAFAAGGVCDDAVADASHTVQLSGSASLMIEATAMQETLAPGGELEFRSQYRNQGTAVATAAFLWAEVPAETVFLRAGLPVHRRLLCSAPPQDILLPQDPNLFDAATFADLFVPGVEIDGTWTCPQGGITSWIALSLDGAALAPPSFVLGPFEEWRLHLRNDRVRDEPDLVQEPSDDGSVIVFAPYIGAADLAAVAAVPAESMVVDGLPFTLSCEPPQVSDLDTLDYVVSSANGVAPLGFELVSGELPRCITLDGSGRLRGRSDQLGQFDFSVRATDAELRQADVSCRLWVVEGRMFFDSFEGEGSLPLRPTGEAPCPGE